MTISNWTEVVLDEDTQRDIKLKALELYLSGLEGTPDIEYILEQLEEGNLSGNNLRADEGNPDPELTWTVWEPFESATSGNILELVDTACDLLESVAKNAVARALSN
jgi:hypothetical protein